MTARPTRHLIALVALAGLALGACGGDDDGSSASTTSEAVSTTSTDDTSSEETVSPEGTDYLAAVATELGDDSDFALDAAAAECLAEALVGVVGVDRLEDEGITPEELADADSLTDLGIDVDAAAVGDLGETLEGCVDFRQVLVDSAPEGYDCLAETADGSRFAEMLADEWVTGTPLDPSVLLFDTAEPACAEQVFLREGIDRGDITEDQAACLADVLDDQVTMRILGATSTQQQPSEDDRLAIDDAFGECGVER